MRNRLEELPIDLSKYIMSLKKEQDRQYVFKMCDKTDCIIGRFIFDLITDKHIKDGEVISTGELCQLYYNYYNLFITATIMTKLLKVVLYDDNKWIGMKKKNRKGLYKINISATYKRLFEWLNNESIKRQNYDILADIVDYIEDLDENEDITIKDKLFIQDKLDLLYYKN